MYIYIIESNKNQEEYLILDYMNVYPALKYP